MGNKKFERVLPDEHPSWKNAAKPIALFLREGPKTWAMMNEFAQKEHIGPTYFLNLLAWLENRNFVRSYYNSDRELLWVSRGFRPAPAPEIPKDEVSVDDLQNGDENGHAEVVVREEERDRKKATQKSKHRKRSAKPKTVPPYRASPSGGPPEMNR